MFRAILKSTTIIFLLISLSSCRGNVRGVRNVTHDAPEKQEQRPTSDIKRYTYQIVRAYPHSENSYTQGLFWHDGTLWESTGGYGESKMMQVDLESGKRLQLAELEPLFFGEGAAVLDNRIYQLTWMEGQAFVYDPKGLKTTATYEYYGEGWGITTDGEKLYMSNGSDEISILNPDGFRYESRFSVTRNGRRQEMINELEWIGGKIWANVYMTDEVIIIDPETGVVEGIIDFSELLEPSDHTPQTDVLNGIAYDATGDRIFVTGKNWKKLFEIKIVEQ